MTRTMLQQELFEQFRDQGMDDFTADILAREGTESDPDGFRFLSADGGQSA